MILLASADDDSNRSLAVYLSTDNDRYNDNSNDYSQLVIERRLLTQIDRVNASLSGQRNIFSWQFLARCGRTVFFAAYNSATGGAIVSKFSE